MPAYTPKPAQELAFIPGSTPVRFISTYPAPFKLSEAIMLGAATIKMKAGDWNSCALGAAMNAVGIPVHHSTYANPSAPIVGRRNVLDRHKVVCELWPWLLDTASKNKIEKITGVDIVNIYGPFRSCWDWGSMITLLFDYEVVGGRMSLEKLVDLVRAVEPDTPDHRFPNQDREQPVRVEGGSEIQHYFHYPLIPEECYLDLNSISFMNIVGDSLLHIGASIGANSCKSLKSPAKPIEPATIPEEVLA